MRTRRVVVVSPGIAHHLGLGATAQPVLIEAVGAEFSVEAFVDAILPRLAGLDIGVDAAVLRGQSMTARDTIRAVVTSQVP